MTVFMFFLLLVHIFSKTAVFYTPDGTYHIGYPSSNDMYNIIKLEDNFEKGTGEVFMTESDEAGKLHIRYSETPEKAFMSMHVAPENGKAQVYLLQSEFDKSVPGQKFELVKEGEMFKILSNQFCASWDTGSKEIVFDRCFDSKNQLFDMRIVSDKQKELIRD